MGIWSSALFRPLHQIHIIERNLLSTNHHGNKSSILLGIPQIIFMIDNRKNLSQSLTYSLLEHTWLLWKTECDMIVTVFPKFENDEGGWLLLVVLYSQKDLLYDSKLFVINKLSVKDGMKFLELLQFLVFLGHLLHVQSLETSYSRLISVKVPVKQLIPKNRSKRLFSTLSWTFQKHPKDFIVGSLECFDLHFL